jgi:hypothetical protein
MIFKAPPQLGHRSTSMSKTRLSSRASSCAVFLPGHGRDRSGARWCALAERERFYCATARWALAATAEASLEAKPVSITFSKRNPRILSESSLLVILFENTLKQFHLTVGRCLYLDFFLPHS